MRAGEIATGLTAVVESLELGARTGDRFSEAPLWLLHGHLLLAGGKGAENDAELSMQKCARGSRAPSFPNSPPATALAQLWQQQGKRGAGLELLKPIYSWFTEGFEYPELRNARALLDQLSKP